MFSFFLPPLWNAANWYSHACLLSHINTSALHWWFVVQPTLSLCSLRTSLVYPTFWTISACWLNLIKLSGRCLPAPTYHPGPKCQSLTLRSRHSDTEWTAVTHFKLWFHDIWWHFCQALMSSETAPSCIALFFDLLLLLFSHVSGETFEMYG